MPFRHFRRSRAACSSCAAHLPRRSDSHSQDPSLYLPSGSREVDFDWPPPPRWKTALYRRILLPFMVRGMRRQGQTTVRGKRRGYSASPVKGRLSRKFTDSYCRRTTDRAFCAFPLSKGRFLQQSSSGTVSRRHASSTDGLSLRHPEPGTRPVSTVDSSADRCSAPWEPHQPKARYPRWKLFRSGACAGL